MTVSELLAELRRRKIELVPEAGDGLRYRAPEGALTPELRAEILARRSEVLRSLRDLKPGPGLAPIEEPTSDPEAALEHFLQGDYLAVVFHSRVLGRDMVLIRDQAALNRIALALPVIYFADCTSHLSNVRALLDVRTEFGPSVALRKVSHA